MMTPAIILKSKFKVPVRTKSSRKFKDYIRYLNRKEAKESNLAKREQAPEIDKKFEKYLDYLSRDQAKSKYIDEGQKGLFTDFSNNLTEKQSSEMYKRFDQAQKNGAVLWQDVYSFDNEWLKENNFLNDGVLNENGIKTATRIAMKKCFDNENLNEHGFWVGAIHYNTDNIHVHIASSEDINTRPVKYYEKKDKDGNIIFSATEPKGIRKKKTEDEMKSVFINSLIDRNQTLERISNLRYELHHSVQISEDSLSQIKLLKQIEKSLPEEKNKWEYNHKAMKNVRPLIDQYTHTYMEKFHPEEFKEYQDLIKADSEMNKTLYGDGDKERKRHEDSAKNKMDDLNAKMGNALLKELKEKKIQQERSEEKRKTETANHKEHTTKEITGRTIEKKKRFRRPMTILTKRDLYKIKRAFNDERKKYDLEIEHRKLEQKIANEKEIEIEYE